jgi:hypothetical protein
MTALHASTNMNVKTVQQILVSYQASDRELPRINTSMMSPTNLRAFFVCTQSLQGEYDQQVWQWGNTTKRGESYLAV